MQKIENNVNSQIVVSGRIYKTTLSSQLMNVSKKLECSFTLGLKGLQGTNTLSY